MSLYAGLYALSEVATSLSIEGIVLCMSYSPWARSAVSSDHQSHALCVGYAWLLAVTGPHYCPGRSGLGAPSWEFSDLVTTQGDQDLSHFLPVAHWLLHGMGRVQGTLPALLFTY